MDLLKEVPGYKGVLKAVIQLQIKQLVDLLSEQTGDECFVLVASIPDKTLCHLGTRQGEDYLKGKDQIKQEFLHHCLQNFNEESRISDEKQKKNKQSSPSIRKKWKRKRLPSNSSSNIDKEQAGKTKSPKLPEDSLTSNDADTTEEMDEELSEDQTEPAVENEPGVELERLKQEIESYDLDMEDETGPKVVDKSVDETIPDMPDEDFNDLLDEDAELNEKIHYDSYAGILQKSDDKFIKGKPLDPDLLTSIIQEVIEQGGDVETGYVPRGVYTRVKKMFGLPATSSVTRRWECYVREEKMKGGK